MNRLVRITLLASCLIVPFAVSSVTATGDENDLFKFLDNLADAATFGYTASQKISIGDTTDSSVMITSPIVVDDLNKNITTYTLQYALEPSLKLIEKNKADQIKKKEFTFDAPGDVLNFELTSKDIDVNKTYYVTVVPNNEKGFPGDVSNEISFNIAEMNQAKADAQDPAPTPATDTTNTADHASAPDMCAANISYVQNDNTVKVTWDVIDKNAKANVYIRHASERDFRKIATIKISDGSYSFVVTRDGTHYLKMEPIDAAGKAHGKECVQTLRLKKVKETTIPVAPNNGPEMKILIAILGLTLFGYLAYRRRQYS